MHPPFPPQRETSDEEGNLFGEDAVLLGAVCLGLLALISYNPVLELIGVMVMGLMVYKHWVTQRGDHDDLS